MSRRRRTAAVAAVAAVLLMTAGCGSRATPKGLATPGSAGGTGTSATAGTAPQAGGTGRPAATPTAPGVTTTPTTQAQPTGGATVHNQDFHLEISAPSCARRGATLPVTIQTEPEADVALIVAFSDGEAHDSQQLGTADRNGAFTAQIPIKTDAPEGDAQLLAAVGRETQGNSGMKPFIVVAPTQPCT